MTLINSGDFEVSIFLTETQTRHSLLSKHKIVNAKRERLQSNSSKLTGWLDHTNSRPVDVDDDNVTMLVEHDEADDSLNLQDYPEAVDDRPPRTDGGDGNKGHNDDDIQSVASDSSDQYQHGTEGAGSLSKVLHGNTKSRPRHVDNDDDKKKIGVRTSYDGFSIYGRILCLIVKQRGSKGKSSSATASDGEKQLLETWVSTQAAQEQVIEDS